MQSQLHLSSWNGLQKPTVAAISAASTTSHHGAKHGAQYSLKFSSNSSAFPLIRTLQEQDSPQMATDDRFPLHDIPSNLRGSDAAPYARNAHDKSPSSELVNREKHKFSKPNCSHRGALVDTICPCRTRSCNNPNMWNGDDSSQSRGLLQSESSMSDAGKGLRNSTALGLA